MNRLYNPEPLPSVQASAAGLLLPVHYIYTNICFHAQKEGAGVGWVDGWGRGARGGGTLTGLHFTVQPGPAHQVFTQKTLMHPVEPLAGDTISSQAPIKPSVSTCDKDGHLFS